MKRQAESGGIVCVVPESHLIVVSCVPPKHVSQPPLPMCESRQARSYYSTAAAKLVDSNYTRDFLPSLYGKGNSSDNYFIFFYEY